MRGAMSRLAAATLVAICLSTLPSPLHATKELQHKKATAAKLKSHGGASNSASSLGRLLAYDLPLPHDWIRESVRDVSVASYSYSYSFSFAYSPTPSPTPNPTTIPVLAPSVQEPPNDSPVGQPGDIPIVQILLVLAGSAEQQDALIAALVAYLMAYMQQVSGQNVVITTEAPEPMNFNRRILSSAPKGRLCTADAPQDEKSIDLRNYDDVAQVEDLLAGIKNGTIILTAVQEDGTSLPVKDSICSTQTTLSFVPPPTDTLDDQSKVKEGPKPLSPLYIALIAVAGVTVLFAAIFLARRHMAPKPRSAVVVSS